MAEPEEDLGWTADVVEKALQRVHPNEMEKGELSDATGLNSQELRAGLEALEERGRLNVNGEGYALNLDGDDPARVPPPPEPDGEEEAGESEQQLAAAAPALQLPGAGAPYRAILKLTVAFAGARGGNADDDAKSTARRLEETVAEIVSEGLNVGVIVELTDLEALQPRKVPLVEEE